VKARFDDRVITVRDVPLEGGESIPTGTHGFVIEAIESPERYEVEFDLETGPVLATVSPRTWAWPDMSHTPGGLGYLILLARHEP
jgi:hypothetical protein